jgi:hypothetical protein
MTIEKGTTNTDKMAVFARVDAAAQSEMKNLAWGLLRKPDTHPVSDKPVTVKVSDALYLWNTRLKNTRLTHRPIRGAELLVDQLRTMASDTELEQIGFKSPKQAANLFSIARVENSLALFLWIFRNLPDPWVILATGRPSVPRSNGSL